MLRRLIDWARRWKRRMEIHEELSVVGVELARSLTAGDKRRCARLQVYRKTLLLELAKLNR